MSSAVDEDRTTTVAPSSPPNRSPCCPRAGPWRAWAKLATFGGAGRHDEAGEHGKSSSGCVGQVGGLGAGQRGFNGVGRVERNDVGDGCRAHAPTPCVGASMRSSTAGRMSSIGGLVPTVAALGQSSNIDAISAATHIVGVGWVVAGGFTAHQSGGRDVCRQQAAQLDESLELSAATAAARARQRNVENDASRMTLRPRASSSPARDRSVS